MVGSTMVVGMLWLRSGAETKVSLMPDCSVTELTRSRSHPAYQQGRSQYPPSPHIHRPPWVLTAPALGSPWRASSPAAAQQQQQWRRACGPLASAGWGAPGISGWAAPAWGSGPGFMVAVACMAQRALDQGSAQSYFIFSLPSPLLHSLQRL